MTKKPWMPLYIGDYLRKTTHLSIAESGAYLHLIMHYWDHGGLPKTTAELAIITKMSAKKFQKMRSKLEPFFESDWRHDRIEEELQRFGEIREKRSRAGVIGAAKRQANAKRLYGRLLKPGHTQSHKHITTTEYVAAREAAEEGNELDTNASAPSDELAQTVRRKGWT